LNDFFIQNDSDMNKKAAASSYDGEDLIKRLQVAEIAWKKWWTCIWQNTTYPMATFLNPVYRTHWFKEAMTRTKGENKRIQDGLTRTGQMWLSWHEKKVEEDSDKRSKQKDTIQKRRRTSLKPIQSIYDMNQAVFGD
jgi:hypothetical protein